MSAGLADLLACVAAFSRALEASFDPQRFLHEFSAHAQALVPHDGRHPGGSRHRAARRERVLLQSERRRRERPRAVSALPPILATSLRIGDVLDGLSAAAKPILDFDVLGVSRLGASGREFERQGLVTGRSCAATDSTEALQVAWRAKAPGRDPSAQDALAE